jgi:hypothetical protein
VVNTYGMRFGLLAIGVCFVLSACSAGNGKSSGRDRIHNAKALVLTSGVPSRHCTTPTAARLDHELVPDTPCMVVLTRYAGLPSRIGTQAVGRVKLRNPSLLRQLTSEFDALPSLPDGVYSCPNDDGSEIVAGLGYPHRQYLRLTITLTGCSTARRGPVIRSALGPSGGKLVGRLERLLALHQ